MSEAKTQPTDTKLADYLAQIADPVRRAECATVAKLMKKITGENAVIWGPSIVGFGLYRYRYASGKEGDWPVAGFASRKNDLTLYIVPSFPRREELLAKLGKHKVGKSCLYLKSLSDADPAVLEELLVESVAAMEPVRVRRGRR